MSLAIFRTVRDLRAQVMDWRAQGLKVALVPTMGALHVGHLSLVETAFKHADRVIASIFVNPTQFGPNEDFDRYPRQEQTDGEMLESVGCSALYSPSVAEMYGTGFATSITVAGLSHDLCGIFRPTHFSGVSTVVAKLLLQAQPHLALFGEKDYQQLTIIRRTVRDLDIPVEIMGVETMREADGLAMSSRNRYLTPAERALAPLLHQTLHQVAERLKIGTDPEPLCQEAVQTLLIGGFASVDYIAVRDAENLLKTVPWDGSPVRILGAAHLGKARLIDNIGFSVDHRKD